ncbi:MAG: hypothetical protein L0Z50_24965 [Verrucomicrobiales bacterium]|nr:hypothetical protein [Verrucomicrobiales bacterium]
MIRWPLFVIGLGLMVCAVIARFQQPALAADARRVDLAEAIALAGTATKQFIEVEASVDMDRRIYSTGDDVTRPVYTGHPPDQVYSIHLGAQSSEWEKYLGNMVRVETGLESRYLRLQIVRDRAFEEKQVLSERLLAPVRGSQYRLWALSDVFPSGSPRGAGWVNQGQVQGHLTRFKDLEENRSSPKFSHDLQQIYRSVEKEYGQAIPENAHILLTDHKSFPQPDAHFYCPIKGSRDTLFAALTPSTIANVPDVLRGVFEAADLRLYADFEKALNTKLPQRIGVLHPETAESFNTRRASGMREVLATGGSLASLGFVGIVWKRLRKSSKRTHS